MDKLRKRVEEGRDEFEVYSSEFDALWPEIEARLNGNKRTLEIKWIWRVAAAFVVGVGITAMLYTKNVNLADADELALQISPEWAETEQYYVDKVNEKIEAIHARNVNLDGVISEDMQLLDLAYSELRNDLADGTDNEEVISAMIMNYQIKLEILERILEEVQERDQDEQNEESFNL